MWRAAAIAGFLALVFVFAFTAGGSETAVATDSQTAILVGDFNQYRTAHGQPRLSADARVDADTQDQANKNAAGCRFGLTYYGGSHTKPSGMTLSTGWNTYGYETAAQVWSAYQADPDMLKRIADPRYNAVSISKAKRTGPGCSLGNIWVFELDHINSIVPPPRTPTPKPSVVPTVKPTPAPTTAPRLVGDVDCDGKVSGADALAILRYLSGSPLALPPGCPPLGR